MTPTQESKQCDHQRVEPDKENEKPRLRQQLIVGQRLAYDDVPVQGDDGQAANARRGACYVHGHPDLVEARVDVVVRAEDVMKPYGHDDHAHEKVSDGQIYDETPAHDAKTNCFPIGGDGEGISDDDERDERAHEER